MSQSGICSTTFNPPIPSLQAFGQVYNQAYQDIANGATFLFDSNGPLVNISHVAGTDSVTITISGYYLVRWMINCSGTGGDITLLKNGIKVASGSFVTSIAATEPIGEAIVSCLAGDIFTLRNNTGVLLSTNFSAGFTNLSMTFEKLTPTASAGAGATSFPTNAGTANEVAGVLNILGASGIQTTGVGNTVTVSLVGGGSAIESITGNDGFGVLPVLGNVNLKTANSNIFFTGAGNTETLDFGASTNLVLGSNPPLTLGLNNTAVGKSALSSVTTGNDNTAIGDDALEFLTTGSQNTSIGSGSLLVVSSGIANTAVGYNAGISLLTGSNNILIGNSAGSNYTGAENNNLIIGSSLAGTVGETNVTRIGNGQTSCFIMGINGVNVGSVAKVVTMASNQLGTATIVGSGGLTVTPTANTITLSISGTGLSWTVITVNQTAAVNNGYICNKAGTLALALPALSAVGDIIAVTNENTATGVQFTQGLLQQIKISTANTSAGVGGTLTSSAIGDTLEMVCITANLTWRVISMVGNWSVV